MPSPLISVIIPTFNRTALLKSCLESLACQTLEKNLYEIVVIDDGSTDATREICESVSRQMRLQYFRIDNPGISAAKNLGVFASRASVLFFFDDDDFADRSLLQEHVEFHHKYPEQNIAALAEEKGTQVFRTLMKRGERLEGRLVRRGATIERTLERTIERRRDEIGKAGEAGLQEVRSQVAVVIERCNIAHRVELRKSGSDIGDAAVRKDVDLRIASSQGRA